MKAARFIVLKLSQLFLSITMIFLAVSLAAAAFNCKGDAK